MSHALKHCQVYLCLSLFNAENTSSGEGFLVLVFPALVNGRERQYPCRTIQGRQPRKIGSASPRHVSARGAWNEESLYEAPVTGAVQKDQDIF